MAEEDYCAERGEPEKDQAEDGVDEAEEGWAYSVGEEANDKDQRGEPSHQPGGHHQDSPRGGSGAQDRLGKGEPVRSDADPVNHGQGIEHG